MASKARRWAEEELPVALDDPVRFGAFEFD